MMTKEERNEEMIKSQRMIIQNEREKYATLKAGFDELDKLFGDTLEEYKQAMNDQFDKRKKLLHKLHETEASLAVLKIYHEYATKENEVV
jgi:thymidylate synthase